MISQIIQVQNTTALLNLIKFKLNLDFHPLTPGEPLRYNPLVYIGELQGYDITSNNSLKKMNGILMIEILMSDICWILTLLNGEKIQGKYGHYAEVLCSLSGLV